MEEGSNRSWDSISSDCNDNISMCGCTSDSRSGYRNCISNRMAVAKNALIGAVVAGATILEYKCLRMEEILAKQI